jgi:hypothetical protein
MAPTLTKTVPNEPAPAHSQYLARFWVCFAVCLVALAVISGMMLAGLFLLMGYRVF